MDAGLLRLQFEFLDFYALIPRTDISGDVSLKWFLAPPSVMYAQSADAQGMIGYSWEHERLQLLLEYIEHFKKKKTFIAYFLFMKKVPLSKTYFKGAAAGRLSWGMSRVMPAFLGSSSIPYRVKLYRLVLSQPSLPGPSWLHGAWRHRKGGSVISPGSRSQLHSRNDLLNA